MRSMVTNGKSTKRSGTTAGLMLSGAVAALALPSAVLAFSSAIVVQPTAELPDETPASTLRAPSIDSGLVQAISLRMQTRGQGFRFTPAGTSTRPDRSITVAVRVDSAARAITVQKGLEITPSALSATTLRIAPNGYNLGVARGYQGFSSSATLGAEIRKIDMPDLSTFRLAGSKGGPSRFSTKLAVDEKESTGRAPGTFETAGQPTVDLGGSYRLTRNLNVTAGVRYSADHDRIAPLTDSKQDSQAVYLGTQFKF
ncbi:MAG: hypothetical protein QM676_03120 [Novosphingobium sp.]